MGWCNIWDYLWLPTCEAYDTMAILGIWVMPVIVDAPTVSLEVQNSNEALG